MHRIIPRSLITTLAIAGCRVWRAGANRSADQTGIVANPQRTRSQRAENAGRERAHQEHTMMKQHGIAAGGAGMGQVCYTRETLERSPWADHQVDCKTTFSSRSTRSWKWHTSCPGPGYEADGEAIFSDR
jgi:hypothetical protein